jgi:hypothetical protein
MLIPARELRGATVGATGGEIGCVQDVYFDDDSWTVLYLVVDTGGWLTGRRVLVSPRSVTAVDRAAGRVDVDLTRAQVEASPAVDTARPISRQEEMAFYRYYGFPYDWSGPYRWGLDPTPAALGIAGEAAPVDRETPPDRRARPTRLRSVAEVLGYAIRARDGDVGHVEDFLVDDWTWAVRYVVVDTRNWWPGKKVLLGPDWVDRVTWADTGVTTSLDRATIRSAPEWDPSVPADREYEARLHEHYRQPKYWERRGETAA